MARPPVAVIALLLAGCVGYRTYPLLQLEAPEVREPLELSGVALLPDRTLVAIAEGDADALLAPVPRVPVGTGGVLELFPLHEGSHFRASVQLERQPITWLPREKRITIPYDVEDLAPMGPDLVIGVTQYDTIGRKSGWRRDYTARSRRQTERLFVLQREGGTWKEITVPSIDRLRETLSDWGRGSCQGDMLVEGLAYDPDGQRVFVGLSRCGGPAIRVLAYDLGSARYGLAVDLEPFADGLSQATPGPEEGITGLSWADGRLWALTAWDSYGYEHEPAYGGRLHEVRDGRLHVVDVPGEFRDRPSALAVVTDPERPGAPAEALDIVVLFDNDGLARDKRRPNATVLRARVPRPAGEKWIELRDLDRIHGALPLALNGFDLRWYARDHRLQHLGILLSRLPDGTPGAWTRALGGRWQMEAGGSMGLWTGGLGLFGKTMGHNKQAVALTDFGNVPGLRFTRYRARLSVIPRDRERQNPSVSSLLDLPDYQVTTSLPAGAAGGGLVLQGFEIDAASRAAEGICLAALQIGVDWAGPERDSVGIRASVIGGICNDFDTRGNFYLHGRTTRQDAAVEVIVHFAVVEGIPTEDLSARIWDRDLPGPRAADGSRAKDPQLALDDASARAHLYCGRFGADGALSLLPRQKDAPPEDWLRPGSSLHGTTTAAAAALRGFTLAFDPTGFETTDGEVTLSESEALARNNYVHRYLVRTFAAQDGLFVEGGVTHGIHRAGPIRDNARPSASLVGVDLTRFPTLPSPAEEFDSVTSKRTTDPNLLPEDGYIRWAFPQPRSPDCSPSW